MPDAPATTAHASSPGGARSLRHLSRTILGCASAGQPTVAFLLETCRALVTFSGADSLDLWLRERRMCARWSLSTGPERFVRPADVPLEELERIAASGAGFVPDVARSCADPGGLPELSPADGHEACRALAWLPLWLGPDLLGLLVLGWREPRGFSSSDADLYEDVALAVAAAVLHHRVQLDQRERVKELTCLYRIAREAAQPWVELAEILSRIVAYLPPGWQYPETTAARILLDGRQYATPGFSDAVHLQRAAIVVDGEVRGMVEVAYTTERPDLDEGPFLEEERSLIDTVAREVAFIIERKQAEADRARLQDQLRHADRLATIGQLAAGVAHELNEPLGGILGFAQLAAKHPELHPEVGSDLARIEAAALHAREVVRNMMLFARQTPPSMEPVQLNTIVEESVSFLGSRFEKAGIDQTCELDEGLPEITADRGQMHQILVNLAVNALQAMPGGGGLSVTTARDDDAVRLTVADTGEGMEEAVRRRVFEPFFTTKDVGEGTGLGLAVVHGIVTAHGGTIDVDSAQGRGSRFVIRLPTEGPNHAQDNG